MHFFVRHFLVLILLGGCVALSGCGRGTSKAGESCGATGDCQGDLRCVEKVCACRCSSGKDCDAAGVCRSPQIAERRITPRVLGSNPALGSTPAGKADGGGDASVAWVKLAGGTYLMGSNDGIDNEQPVHEVTLSGFEMTKTEVTRKQHKACVAAGTCKVSFYDMPVAPQDDQPADCISWEQAKRFCTFVGARLCTEAEWEYAARSGGKDQTYPWGNEKASCKYAVMNDGDGGGEGCGTPRPWAVCSKPAGNSEQGVCDLVGNVHEWVEDEFAAYPSQAQTNPRNPATSNPVNRGGSWRNTRSYGTFSASDRGMDIESYGRDAGIRCCKSLTE